jgi:hypothetical protein
VDSPTLILVHTAHPQALSHAGPGFGRLLSPRQDSRAAATAAAGIPWAADNDAFSRWDAGRFTAMLGRITGLAGCRFVAAPDVVADAPRTAQLFDSWLAALRATGQPPAFVIQDGQLGANVPWDEIGALFVGGTTEYKLSADAERLGREARRRGLWLHIGRVNSRRRFDYARAVGAHSVDGSGFSMFRDTLLPDALTWHRQPLQERLPA